MKRKREPRSSTPNRYEPRARQKLISAPRLVVMMLPRASTPSFTGPIFANPSKPRPCHRPAGRNSNAQKPSRLNSAAEAATTSSITQLIGGKHPVDAHLSGSRDTTGSSSSGRERKLLCGNSCGFSLLVQTPSKTFPRRICHRNRHSTPQLAHLIQNPVRHRRLAHHRNLNRAVLRQEVPAFSSESNPIPSTLTSLTTTASTPLRASFSRPFTRQHILPSPP